MHLVGIGFTLLSTTVGEGLDDEQTNPPTGENSREDKTNEFGA